MATVVKDLGAVTAYAYAVAGGYSGTEAEFEALLGNIAEDLSEIENLSVTVTTLPAGSSATASYSNGVLSLGIPKGDKGDKGDTGATGATGATGPQGIPGDVANLASAYSASSTYGVGDYCIYNSQLYRCTTPITTAETWTAAHWAAAVLGDDVGDLKSAFANLVADVGISPVNYTSVSGKYINKNGTVSTSAPFSHTNPFAVGNGDLIIVKATGYLTEVAMIATCDSDLSNISVKVKSIDSTNRTYTYLCESDGYVVASYNTAAGCDITLKSAESNERLDSRLTAIEDAEKVQNALVYDSRINILVDSVTVGIGQSSKYVNKNGGVSNSNNFYITSPIAIQKGQTIRFNCKGYLTEVAMLASVENGVYTPLIVSADNDEHILTYTCMVDMNVVISCIVTVTSKYSVYASQIGLNNARITALEHDFVAFATMGVIGDSLASGASNYSNGVADRPVYSWGKYIEREHGIAVSLFSFGGATTRTWFTNSNGQTALNNGDVLDCYVIGLGVNDAYSLGASYLGSVSDVHVGNENQNADTYYGNYSKIIATIKAKSPRAKIFCITNPKNTASIADSFNDAIKAISALYTNVYVIDLGDDDFYLSKEFTNTWYSAHSTALGYKLIAKNLYTHISDIIKNNISEFTDIQWIAENHA